MLVYCTLKCGLHIEIYIILDTFDFVCILLMLFFAISLTVVGKKLLWKRVVCVTDCPLCCISGCILIVLVQRGCDLKQHIIRDLTISDDVLFSFLTALCVH